MKSVWVLCAVFWAAMLSFVPSPVFAGPVNPPMPLPRAERDALVQKAPEAALAAKRKLGLQTELPEGPKKIEPEDYRTWWKFQRLEISPGAARVILFLSIAMILVVFLSSMRTNLWSASRARRMERGGVAEDAAPEAVALRMGQAQIEADDLARAGSFAEAMHVLLLQSIGELRLRLRVPISVSLTSREILRGIALSPEGYSAFADIIGRVEISYFGTHQPEADDYAACRRSYDALFAVLRQGSFS